jgi:hypothetical protein
MQHKFRIAADVDTQEKKDQSIHDSWWNIISANLGPWLELLDAINRPDVEHFLDQTVVRSDDLFRAKQTVRHGVIIMANMIPKFNLNLLITKDIYTFLVVGFYIGHSSRNSDDQITIVRRVQSLFLEVYSINNHPSNPEDAYNEAATSLGINMAWPESLSIQSIPLH